MLTATYQIERFKTFLTQKYVTRNKQYLSISLRSRSSTRRIWTCFFVPLNSCFDTARM